MVIEAQDLIYEQASFLSWQDLISYIETNRYNKTVLSELGVENRLWQAHLDACFPGIQKTEGISCKAFFIEQYQLCKTRVMADGWHLQTLPDALKQDRSLKMLALNSEINRLQDNPDYYNEDRACSLIMHDLFDLEDVQHAFSQQNSRLRNYCASFTPNQLSTFIKQFSEAQLPIALNAIKDRLPSIICDSDGLSSVFFMLDTGRYRILLSIIKEHLKDIIKDGHGLCSVTTFGDKEKKQILLDVIETDLKDFAKDGIQLRWVLRGFDVEQCKTILNAIKVNLKDILKDGKQLHSVLYRGEKEKGELVFDAIKANLKDMIKDGEQLGYVLEFLNKEQRKFVLNTLKDELKNIIKDGANLGKALRYMDYHDGYIFLKLLKHDLKTIIPDVDNFVQANKDAGCGHLHQIFDAMRPGMKELLKDSESCSNLLRNLYDQEKDILFADRDFVLKAMRFDRGLFNEASENLKLNDRYLKSASYVPFMAFILQEYPYAIESVQVGLIYATLTLAVALTCGVSLLPSAAIAVTAGVSIGSAGFFFLAPPAAQEDNHDEPAMVLQFKG